MSGGKAEWREDLALSLRVPRGRDRQGRPVRSSDYVVAPRGETPEDAQARRAGGSFTLAEARDERAKARVLVKQVINPAHRQQLDRIKRDQESPTTFEAVAKEWLALEGLDGHDQGPSPRYACACRVPEIWCLARQEHHLGAYPRRAEQRGQEERPDRRGRSQAHHVWRV